MTRRRHFVAALPLAVLLPASAQPAPPPELEAALPGARLQGSALMRYFGFRVYEVGLWVGATEVGSDWGVPLALSIEYARALDGRAIAERSLQEMRRQGPIGEAEAGRWLDAMTRLFPDVREGDRLTGVHEPGRGARFFFNGQPRGAVDDARFAQRFFGIWLAPQTSEPALRTSLLGAARPAS